MQRRFRQVFAVLREQSCVTYAQFATVGGFCDVNLIVIKATSPDDLPLPDKYVHELLQIFSISPSSFRAFSLSFIRRFGKTRCWRVALKCLLLLHRLLRSVPEDSPFRAELLWTRANGLISLHPCHFRDDSSSSVASEEYTTFIRSYAHLIDEALNCFSLNSTDYDKKTDEGNFLNKMKQTTDVIELLPQLQTLIDRVIDCRPTGSAARNFSIRLAMKHIIRDSFVCYTTFRREIVSVLENLLQMPYRSCIAAFGIYKKAALQADQLCEFYDWCKEMNVCGFYEYPLIERIPGIQVRALENFLSGMWQLTESSSSQETSPSSTSMSGLTDQDDDGRDQREDTGMDIVIRSDADWVTFEDKDQPLIQFDDDDKVIDDNNIGWEAILEASITSNALNPFYQAYNILPNYNYGYFMNNPTRLSLCNGSATETKKPGPAESLLLI